MKMHLPGLPPAIRVLLVDDSPEVHGIVTHLLSRSTTRYLLTGEVTFGRGLDRLTTGGFDVAILDQILDQGSGLELLERIRSRGDTIPVIFLTGEEEEGIDLRAWELGASDFIPKRELRSGLLDRSLRYALRSELARRQLEKDHDDLVTILDHLAQGVGLVDAEGHLTFLNRTACKLLDLERNELGTRSWETELGLADRDRERMHRVLQLPAKKRAGLEIQRRGRDGRDVWFELQVQEDPRSPTGKLLLLEDRTDVHHLRDRLEHVDPFHGLIGSSAPMQAVFQRVREFAPLEWTVLIQGESGSGKELVARAVHQLSPRKESPFLAVNCAGLTESLLASQLFGHRRGSFTGAISDHKGFFEAAQGGTLFLDEIGDLPLPFQASLLRVLQEGEITRVGDSHPRKVNVRVLAATHRDLAQEVAAGRFRLDLLYRLKVATILMPALRERVEDIPLLAREILNDLRLRTGLPVLEPSPAFLAHLHHHDWPGNVRELRSVIEVAAIRCAGPRLEPRDLPDDLHGPGRAPAAPLIRKSIEMEEIHQAVASCGGNRSLAARKLGISRATLYRKLSDR